MAGGKTIMAGETVETMETVEIMMAGVTRTTQTMMAGATQTMETTTFLYLRSSTKETSSTRWKTSVERIKITKRSIAFGDSSVFSLSFQFQALF